MTYSSAQKQLLAQLEYVRIQEQEQARTRGVEHLAELFERNDTRAGRTELRDAFTAASDETAPDEEVPEYDADAEMRARYGFH